MTFSHTSLALLKVTEHRNGLGLDEDIREFKIEDYPFSGFGWRSSCVAPKDLGRVREVLTGTMLLASLITTI